MIVLDNLPFEFLIQLIEEVPGFYINDNSNKPCLYSAQHTLVSLRYSTTHT